MKKYSLEFAQWHHLPDIELYMDQLLTYINRQVPQDLKTQDLSKSMVNNYIKQEIIPRPNGKRYGKAHIAQLTILSILKEVFTIQECKDLFSIFNTEEGMEGFGEDYNIFLESIDGALAEIEDLYVKMPNDEKKKQILYFSILSYLAKHKALQLLANP